MTNPFLPSQGTVTAPAPAAAPVAAPVTTAPVAAPAASPIAAPTQASAPAAPVAGAGGIASPSGAPGGHKFTDDLGAQVLVRPLGTLIMSSPYAETGKKEVVRADWIVLDGPNQGQLRENSLIIHDALIEELRTVLDGPDTLLGGRLVQRQGKDTSKKPAFVFDSLDENGFQLAEQARQAFSW